MIHDLRLLVKNGGNCVNLGRHIKTTDTNLYDWVISETQFLPETCRFNERVYCLMNDIKARQLDAFGVPARFINLFEGYSLKAHAKQRHDSRALRKTPKETIRKRKDIKRPNALTDFIKRNRKRNAHLYDDDTMQPGEDYVICPISGERMSMIKVNYITKILGMDPDDYPDVQRICNKRMRNIKEGLKSIDSQTGLTKHQLAVVKTKQKLGVVDSHGVTGYQKKGQKTRATHMNNIDEYGRNGYQRQVHHRLTTILENGLTIEQNAHLKQQKVLKAKGITRVVGASKQSKIVLAPIIEFLEGNKVKFYFDKTEYLITDPVTNNKYFYDLTVPELKIVIEYQSESWHANPCMDATAWKNWKPPKGKLKTADEVLQYDYAKARAIYNQREFITYYVWQSSQENDVKEILCLLKTLIMKY